MKFLTTTASNQTFLNIALFAVRVFVGFAMISHGYPKLQKLTNGEEIQFMDFLGLGATTTLCLVVFAEFIGSIFLILGLFSRFFLAVLTFTMMIAALVAHGGDPFSKMESSLLYLSIYILLLATGPGKFSIDAMINKRRESRW